MTSGVCHVPWSWRTAGGWSVSGWSVWSGRGEWPSGTSWRADWAQTQSISRARAYGRPDSSPGTPVTRTPGPAAAGTERSAVRSPAAADPSPPPPPRDWAPPSPPAGVSYGARWPRVQALEEIPLHPPDHLLVSDLVSFWGTNSRKACVRACE